MIPKTSVVDTVGLKSETTAITASKIAYWRIKFVPGVYISYRYEMGD